MDLGASNPDLIHVGNVDLIELLVGKGTWTAVLALTMHLPDETVADQITVTGRWRSDDGYDNTTSCTTSGTKCEISSGDIPNKNDRVMFTVEAAARDGSGYDANANHDPDPDSDGTTITILKSGKDGAGDSGGDGGGGGKPCNPHKKTCT